MIKWEAHGKLTSIFGSSYFLWVCCNVPHEFKVHNNTVYESIWICKHHVLFVCLCYEVLVSFKFVEFITALLKKTITNSGQDCCHPLCYAR